MGISYVGGDVGGGNVADIVDLAWPAGVAPRQCALLVWTYLSTSTPVNPVGWEVMSVVTGDSGSMVSQFCRRQCDGTESGAVTLSAPPANRQSAVLGVYRGTHPVDGLDNWAFRDEGAATTSHACPPITTGYDGCVVCSAVSERATSGTADYTTTSTERLDTGALATGSGGTTTAWADDGLATYRPKSTVVTPPPWVGTISTGNAITWAISLRPATAPPPPNPVRRRLPLLVR